MDCNYAQQMNTNQVVSGMLIVTADTDTVCQADRHIPALKL